jgi:hypothetical protein
MNIERTLLFRAIVMVTLISSCIYLTYGKDSPSIVYIVRNVAWNDFIAQIASVPYESPRSLAISASSQPMTSCRQKNRL